MTEITTRTGQRISVGHVVVIRNSQARYKVLSIWKEGAGYRKYAAIQDMQSLDCSVVKDAEIKCKQKKGETNGN